MREVFADTAYWIALISPTDNLHQAAVQVCQQVRDARIVTSDAVLSEFLNMFAERGAHLRNLAAQAVEKIFENPNVHVEPQTRAGFLDALALYRNRLDKGYSLTDCLSMNVIRQRAITEVLTSDHHFEQEGFVILLKPQGSQV